MLAIMQSIQLPTHRPWRCLTLSALLIVFLAAGSGVACLQAGEEQKNATPLSQPATTAIVSDRNSQVNEELPSNREIAREILQIQQRMGGSVVSDRAGLQDWDYARSPVTPQRAPHWPPTPLPRTPQAHSSHVPQALSSQRHSRTAMAMQINKVDELREAAWELETTAYRLEKLDLYAQADALREVATRLRRDARVMKQRVDK